MKLNYTPKLTILITRMKILIVMILVNEFNVSYAIPKSQTLVLSRFLCPEITSSTPTWIAPVQINCVVLAIIVITSKVRKLASLNPRLISLHANPMARRVRAQVPIEEAAAECKLGAVHWRMFLRPVTEVPMPTTPAIRANTTKKPVAMLPIGKYIGNRWAGGDSTDADSRAFMIPWLIAHAAIIVMMKYKPRLRNKRKNATDLDPEDAMAFCSLNLLPCLSSLGQNSYIKNHRYRRCY